MQKNKEILSVELSLDNQIFMRCNYLHLDPYAPTTTRKFVFKEISERKDVNIEFRSRITIRTYCTSRRQRRSCLHEFDILLFDFGNMSEDEWCTKGIIYTNYEDSYNQGSTDVLHLWQNGKDLDWFSLPKNSEAKGDYMAASLYYSGISTEILEKDVYTIDFSLIKEENDFLYLVSNEFLGARSYLGSSIFTFDDCLLEIYNEKGYKKDKKIVFLNTDRIHDIEMEKLLEEVRGIFSRYGFSV